MTSRKGKDHCPSGVEKWFWILETMGTEDSCRHLVQSPPRNIIKCMSSVSQGCCRDSNDTEHHASTSDAWGSDKIYMQNNVGMNSSLLEYSHIDSYIYIYMGYHSIHFSYVYNWGLCVCVCEGHCQRENLGIISQVLLTSPMRHWDKIFHQPGIHKVGWANWWVSEIHLTQLFSL